MSDWQPRQSNEVVTAWKAGKSQPSKGWDVDASSFYRELQKLELKLQRKSLNTINRRVGMSVLVPKLKRYAPVGKYPKNSGRQGGQLKRSMGTKTGRQKHMAAVYVGPRVPFGWNAPGLDHKPMRISGRIANVLEYSKGRIKKKTRFRAIMWAARHRVEAATFAEIRQFIMTR